MAECRVEAASPASALALGYCDAHTASLMDWSEDDSCVQQRSDMGAGREQNPHRNAPRCQERGVQAHAAQHLAARGGPALWATVRAERFVGRGGDQSRVVFLLAAVEREPLDALIAGPGGRPGVGSGLTGELDEPEPVHDRLIS